MSDGLSVYNSQLDAFELYHQVQEDPEKSTSNLSSPALPALGNAVAGAIGASISNVCTYPLAMVITRLQIQRQLRNTTNSPDSEEYKSIEDAFRKVFEREGGLSGFYVGVVSDTTKTVADSFLFFFAYNFIRQSRLRSRGPTAKYLPVLDELSVGFLAGAFSKFLTTPIANIVTRKQTSSMLSARSPNKTTDQDSTHSIAKQIHKEKGLPGFWSGYSASLILTLNPSLTFFLFETLKRLLLSRSQRANPSARAIFVLAALSKTCASSITYPFSLAKSRLQASNRSSSSSSGKEKAKASVERRPSNVFTTLLATARTDGILALYEGLSGEVLKGFFSHGITMLAKERVHRFVIRLYYLVLRILKSMPSAKVVAEGAKLKGG